MKHSRILHIQNNSPFLSFTEKDKQKKTRRKVKTGLLILVACLFLETTATRAQVTIGSLLDPAEGALLDLKDQLPDADNVTASGGLLLPRVKLTDPDHFSLMPDMTGEQLKNHTGLLVYNLKIDETLSLEKGIYQWDGEKWRKLNKITKTESVATKKKIYTADSPNDAETVSIGIFEFRMKNADNNNKVYYPQFRLQPNMASQSVYWQVNEYWDKDTNSMATDRTDSGYTFSLKNSNVDSSNWVDCMNSMENLERNEVWFADIKNNHMYQIQFVIISNGSSNTYLIIAKQY